MTVVRRAILASMLLACACGGPPAPHAPEGREPVCRVAVAPSAGASGVVGPPAPSRAVAHVTIPLAQVRSQLETRVPRRLAEERDRDLGVAGRLQTTVDRGPIAVTVQGESLVVRAPVHARAEACAKGRCYASCEPEAVATVTVPLRLGPDFGFAPSRAEVAFTRGCQVRALGGFVRIDVTPMIEGVARAELRRIERDVDAQLPKLRPQVERTWRLLEEPRKLPLGCIETKASGLVQGPSSGDATSLRMRFALAATPEVRAACGAPAPPRPLPPLLQDPSMPAEDELEVAFVSPAATTALLRGVDCGEADLHALGSAPAWAEDGRSVRLGTVAVAEPGREGLGPRLAADVRLAPLLAPDGLRDALPALASGLADATLDVRANVRSVTTAPPAKALFRGPDLVATARLRGSVEMRFK